jgi:DNA-binding LacI/PurR family transcriptional regulator
MRNKVTLQDISNDTGLSVSTVSRALARTGNISKENELRVFESAHRLNYPIQSQQTPIELRDQLNIALVTNHYSGEFFASLFEGFDDSARALNIRINLISLSHTNTQPEELLHELKKARLDGAVIFLPDYKEADYQAILHHITPDFPIVSIAPIASPILDTVTFDNYRGGHLVASHFEEQGFRKLGVIHGPNNRSEALLRKNGFIDYIRASSQLELVWEFDGDYSLQRGKDAYEAYRQLNCKPEAIFCSNDETTIGFLYNAIRDGVKIPDDVAVAGFDDLSTCGTYTPTITSVHTPYALLGKKALEIVLDRLRNPHHSPHSGYTNLVPVSLSVRESSTETCYALQG